MIGSNSLYHCNYTLFFIILQVFFHFIIIEYLNLNIWFVNAFTHKKQKTNIYWFFVLE